MQFGPIDSKLKELELELGTFFIADEMLSRSENMWFFLNFDILSMVFKVASQNYEFLGDEKR